jgi:hypothetical protein
MKTAYKTFEELLLEVKVAQLDRVEMMAYFSNQGVPMEIVTRMERLWYQTIRIADRVFEIGKVIILKLIRFIKQNSNMMIGVAIGVGLGTLASMLPLIGHLISPIVTVVFSIYASLQGHRIDKAMRGEFVGHNVFQDAITAATLFWAFFVDIFTTLKIA